MENKTIVFCFALFSFISTLNAQRSWRAEVTLQGMSSDVIVPRLLSETFQSVESGSGNNLGLGIIHAFNEKFAVRGGYQHWKMAFSPAINVKITDGRSAIAKETGHIHYDGIYLRLDRTWRHFFLTTGFDFSFASKYRNDISVKDLDGNVAFEDKNVDASILTRKFSQQFSVVLGLGPSVPIGKRFLLRGEVNAVLPISPIYDTGVSVPTLQIDFNGNVVGNGTGKVDLDFFPIFKYGLSVSYLLK